MSSEKKSYRHTLNLPETPFSIRAKAAEKEPELQKRWASQGVVDEYFKQSFQEPSFTLHDGPPYANGGIHMGHALNKVLKDIIVRSKKMAGFNVSFIPGWDCHGLPIELKVTSNLTDEEKNNPISVKKACREYAQKWVDTQAEQFRSLGVWTESERPYITMSHEYQSGILSAFASLVENGHIERKGKTVPWCASCQTTLSNAEIEYQDRKDPSCYIAFDLDDQTQKNLFPDISIQVSALIWTTTPWTIPLNRAVTLHPNAEYVVMQISPERAVIVGAQLSSSIAATLGVEGTVLATFKSTHLAGSRVKHPIVPTRTVPFVFDDGVGLSDGTACVHCAPGCGPEDYIIGIKNGLEIYSPLTSAGTYDSGIDPEELEGVSILDGQWWSLKKLKETGNLVHKASIRHSYPHCWRCRNGLMFRATDQWFCNLSHNDLSGRAHAALKDVAFIPEWGRTRLESFIQNRTEWCISRQRAWGIPIPAIHDADSGSYLLTPELTRFVSERVKTQGIEFWDTVSIDELIESGVVPEQFLDDCNRSALKKETDILDVWLDSGVSHHAALKPAGKDVPVDLYLEGSDQHRGWFQSSLLTSTIMKNASPTKAFLTHGFIVDKNGHKMSKSAGNGIEPQEIIDKYGADVLRLWVASVDYERDVALSEELLKNTAEVYRKMRNTCRFLMSNLYDYNDADNAVGYDKLLPIDRYALSEAFKINAKVQKLYEEYRFPLIVQTLARYCTVDLSSFYLDICKDRLYTEQGDARRSAQTVLHRILLILMRLMAPIIPHTTEDMYDSYPGARTEGKESVHLEAFYKEGAAVDVDDHVWEALKAVRGIVLKAIEQKRAVGQIKHSLEVSASVAVAPNSAYAPAWERAQKEIEASGQDFSAFLAEWCIASQIRLSVSQDVTYEEQGVSVAVSRADGGKCPRCWKVTQTDHEDHICSRCIEYI